MNNQNINVRGTQALKAIQASNGRFFNVKFKKKNGEHREMQARLGVKKFHKGGDNTTQHISKYLTVYENGKLPKNVNLNTVYEVSVNGQKIVVGG